MINSHSYILKHGGHNTETLHGIDATIINVDYRDPILI